MRWSCGPFPESSRAYAEGLLKTVEFLSGRETGVPALATGAGETRHLSERLTMILNQRVPLTTTRAQRWTIAVAAAAVLLIFPTWAEPDGVPSDAENPPRQELLDLRQASIEIEQQMRQLELQRMELERRDAGGRAARGAGPVAGTCRRARVAG